MTEGLAIEIVEHKMRELGVGENYLLRYRHFQLEPGGKRVLKTLNHLFILLTPDVDSQVSSRNGVFDLKDTTAPEMQYLHNGEITLVNQNPKFFISIKFLQVIPTNKIN